MTSFYFDIFAYLFTTVVVYSDGKESAYNVGDLGSVPGSGRFPGEGNGYSLLYSCLGNPMHRGAWQPRGHRVAMSWTKLSD